MDNSPSLEAAAPGLYPMRFFRLKGFTTWRSGCSGGGSWCQAIGHTNCRNSDICHQSMSQILDPNQEFCIIWIAPYCTILHLDYVNWCEVLCVKMCGVSRGKTCQWDCWNVGMVEGGFLGGLVCCAEDNHLAPQRGSGCTTIWIHLDGSFTFIPHVLV